MGFFNKSELELSKKQMMYVLYVYEIILTQLLQRKNP